MAARGFVIRIVVMKVVKERFMTSYLNGAPRSLWLLSFAVVQTCTVLCAPMIATAKQKPRTALMVQGVLSAEAKGEDGARDASLARIIAIDPDFAQARWAAGQIQRDGKWVKFDVLDGVESQAEVRVEYRRLRESMSDTAEGHLKIANWCHSRGLPDERRAHLLRVLDLDSNRADVRALLKMVRVGDVWMLPGEARQAAARGKQAAADLKHWLPKVERLRLTLSGAPGRGRDMAAKHVRAIDDPRAIIALEVVLAPASDEAGAAVVDALAAMKQPQAAIALARLAAFSESLETTDAARAKLKTHSMYAYVPAMLSSLVVPGPIQSRVVPRNVYRFGRLLFHQSVVYERADRKIAAVFDDAYWIPHSGYGLASDASLAANVVGSATTATRTLAIETQNRQLERTNHRIMETLRAVTKHTLPDDPRAWWHWWDELNEIATGSKPTETFVVSLEQSLPSREAFLVPPCSCLIAGTPVWTERGSVAIEAMRIGDRVLAQDVASGELAYKSVLRTTIRKRAPLFHISLSGETVVASGGHPFWVAGQGWVSARLLKAGMTIHTVTGAVSIVRIKEESDADQAVFNLVVEDFHNYFAGEAHLLLHDNTMREPTIGPVPGWMGGAGSTTASNSK